MAERSETSTESLSTWCETSQAQNDSPNLRAIRIWNESIPRDAIPDVHEVMNETCIKAASNRGDDHAIRHLLIQNDRFALLRLHRDYVCWLERTKESSTWHAVTAVIKHTPGEKKSDYMRMRTSFKNVETQSQLRTWNPNERLYYPTSSFLEQRTNNVTPAVAAGAAAGAAVSTTAAAAAAKNEANAAAFELSAFTM